MADVKVSGLPSDTSLDGNHYTILNDPTGPTTKRTLLSTLAAFFFNQLNIPDGSGSPRTRMTEIEFDFVASGLVWSGDAYGSTRLASMTSGVVYINGRRLTISAVVSRTFTASKDTYIDILDNGDGTATIVYTEVANNAASPALAANSIRIGIIVTGASNIAAVGSVNQGQETKVLPIVSSIPYQVTDSLGNLICPRDPNRKLLGFRQIFAGQATTSATAVQILGLTCPVIVPTGRKVKVTLYTYFAKNATATSNINSTIWDGVVASGTQLASGVFFAPTNGYGVPMTVEVVVTPAANSKTYNGGVSASGSTATFDAAANQPGFIKVELV